MARTAAKAAGFRKGQKIATAAIPATTKSADRKISVGDFGFGRMLRGHSSFLEEFIEDGVR
jgi:hypothetical protein